MGPRSGRPLVLAHRGAHDDETPENTLAAFAGAVVLGADGIEFDVRRAADGELVVFHDYAIGRDALDSLSSEAIRELAGYPVPTLGDVLEWALDGVILDVELKEDGYVAEVAEQLCDFAQRGGSLIVTSFIDPVLAQLGQLAPQIRRGLLIGITGIGAVARAHECEAQTLVIQAKLASDELLDELDAAGLECLVWDLGRSGHEHARFLGDPRVVGVITDDIAWALAQRAR